MKHRGLFYCGYDETCGLAPEIWRGENGSKIGLCAKHALLTGWIDKMPEPIQEAKPVENNKGFLQRLLDGIENGTIADVLDKLFPHTASNSPTTEPTPHWSEYRDYPF